MPTPDDDDKKRRLALSQCMVEILRPASAVDDLALNERLVGYAIAAGAYAGQALGIHKLTATVGLPRSTVRGVLDTLMARGWVIRRADKTYDFSTEFHAEADAWFQLEQKYMAVVRAAETLTAIGKTPKLKLLAEAESDPKPVDKPALKEGLKP